MRQLLVPMVVAMLAVVSIVAQQASNSNLHMALNSAAWSGFMGYFVGVVCMVALAIVLRDPAPSVAVASRIPW